MQNKVDGSRRRKEQKSKSKNLVVGSYLQISFSSAKKLYEVDAEKSSSFL